MTIVQWLPGSQDQNIEAWVYVSGNKQRVYIQSDKDDEQLLDHHHHYFLDHI
jgi:hypothetical protein